MCSESIQRWNLKSIERETRVVGNEREMKILMQPMPS